MGHAVEVGKVANPTDGGFVGSFGQRVSRDLDHYRAQPGNWNVKATQLSPGTFQSVIDFLELPGITVYHNAWQAATRIRGQSPSDLFFLATDVDPGRSNINWCGRKADSRHWAFAPAHADIDFTVSPEARDVVLLISPSLAEYALGAGSLDKLNDSRHVVFDAASAEELQRVVLREIRRFRLKPALAQGEIAMSDSRSRIFRAVEHCFASVSGSYSDAVPAVSSDEALHTALLHADALRGNTSALDMSYAAGISQRALEQAFSRSLGITPGKYLKQLRLNEVHHILADASPWDVRVTDVATSMGFSHLSRFAREYRALFGELPSETLARG